MNHYDIEAVERQARTAVAGAVAEARRRAKTEDDLAYIDVQEICSELLVVSSRVVCHLINHGASAEMVWRALGNTLGSIAVSAAGAGGQEQFERGAQAVMNTMAATFNALVSGDAPKGSFVASDMMRPMQGGRA